MKKLILLLLSVCLFVGDASQAAISPALLAAAHRRNNSGFVPTQVAGMKRWGEARLLTGLSNNDPVSTYTDFSGQGNNATQTSTLRPLYITNVKNGQPCLRFDGVDDYMPLGTNLTTTSAYTAFLLYKKRTTGVNMMPYGITYTGGDTSLGFPFFEQDTGTSYVSGSTTLWQASHTSTGSESNYIMITVIVTSSSVYNWYINGAVQPPDGTIFSGGTFSNVTNIGSRFNLGAYSDGDICVDAFYDSALGNTDVNNLLDYWGALYGISMTHL